MSDLVPDIGQGDGEASEATLQWVSDVIDQALASYGSLYNPGLMPTPPAPIDPGALDKLVRWLVLIYQGLDRAEAPDLAEHPA